MELPVNYSELTPAERRIVRRQYILLQRGKCLYCKEDLANPAPKWVTDKPICWKYFPPDFLKYPVHLQHSHTTDKTEGVVHSYCNAVMWQYEGE